MTDTYGYADDSERADEAAAAPTNGGRSSYHGRTATLRDGTRVMWQESPNGRGGRFVRLSENVASNQARETLQNERIRLGTLTRTAPMAEEYIRIGANVPTGSWGARSLARERQGQADSPDALWHGLNMPVQFEPNRSGLERLAQLEDQALRGNIPQGGAQTANSAFEQQVLRGLFPSINNLGSVNRENAASLLAERDLQRMRVAEMESWLQSHPDFSDFETHWAGIQDQQRPNLVADYRQRLARMAWEASQQPESARRGVVPEAAARALLAGEGTDAQFDELFGEGSAARVRAQAAGRR